MAYLDGYYLNSPHVWQFDGSTWASSNCTPTTGANALMAVSGGKLIRTGAQIRSLVLRREESQPALPGWSQHDLALAMKRVYPSQPYAIRNGFGWDELVKDHEAGYYLAVQGDSDQFTTPKCSAKFDGDHCFGAHPATRHDPDTGREQWWSNDPICPTGHWKNRKDIYEYAMKLGDKYHTDLFWGHLSKTVPKQPISHKWGSDVPADVRAVDPPSTRTQKAFVKQAIGYATVINMRDLERLCRAWGVDYKTVVNPIDLRAVLAKARV